VRGRCEGGSLTVVWLTRAAQLRGRGILGLGKPKQSHSEKGNSGCPIV
jgi:hypothetical protein